MKNKYLKWIILVVAILAISISACVLCVIYLYIESKKPAETLEDLAYTKGRKGENTIYLEEDGELTPYLVLEENYGDSENVLLLRKYVESKGNWNDWKAYYNESTIDKYLNEKFIEELSIKERICDTDILISSRYDQELETINRKIFLLSASEVGAYDKYLVLKEGDRLKYFKDYTDRIAYTEDGEAKNWWLRTPDVMIYNVCVYVVGSKGGVDCGDCKNNVNFDRPAFCLPPDLPVTQQELDGELVYVVKEE